MPEIEEADYGISGPPEVGDLVLCVDGCEDNKLLQGRTYTVKRTELFFGDHFVTILELPGFDWLADRFEVVRKARERYARD